MSIESYCMLYTTYKYSCMHIFIPLTYLYMFHTSNHQGKLIASESNLSSRLTKTRLT
jgi:hypothetical protein